jgi:hypothetical protein
VDGAPHRGGMLGSESMGAMRSCLNEILPEFQEGGLGGGKNAAENMLHCMWSLNLDLRSKILHYIWGLKLDVRSKCSV